MSADAGAAVVPVLLYHAVGTDRSDWIAPFTVSVPTFRRHLELIAASGRIALSVEELRLALSGELQLSHPAVAITFDDGFGELADVVAQRAVALADAGHDVPHDRLPRRPESGRRPDAVLERRARTRGRRS